MRGPRRGKRNFNARSAGSARSAALSTLRMAARSWITVSWVATASNSGVESSTRRRPSSNPAASAVVLTSSNNRRGRSDFRSRASRPAPSGEWPPRPPSTPRLPSNADQTPTGQRPLDPRVPHRPEAASPWPPLPGRHSRAAQYRTREQIGEVLIAEQRSAVLGQQPIDTAPGQLITYQQHHVIETALPILTSQSHTPILSVHPHQTRSATPKPATKSAPS